MIVSKFGVTYDLESTLEQVLVRWSEDAPSSVGSNVEFPSAEGVCYVGLAGYSVEFFLA